MKCVIKMFKNLSCNFKNYLQFANSKYLLHSFFLIIIYCNEFKHIFFLYVPKKRAKYVLFFMLAW